MGKFPESILWIILVITTLLDVASLVHSHQIQYPSVKRDESVVDDYHGTKVRFSSSSLMSNDFGLHEIYMNETMKNVVFHWILSFFLSLSLSLSCLVLSRLELAVPQYLYTYCVLCNSLGKRPVPMVGRTGFGTSLRIRGGTERINFHVLERLQATEKVQRKSHRVVGLPQVRPTREERKSLLLFCPAARRVRMCTHRMYLYVMRWKIREIWDISNLPIDKRLISLALFTLKDL